MLTDAEVRLALQEFYRWWLQDTSVYIGRFGLCGALYEWCQRQEMSRTVNMQLRMAQADMFFAAGLDVDYPFNRMRSEFHYEATHGLIRENGARIAWAREHTKGE